MAHGINVFMITGFLGSGKTTFLNRLIKQFPRDSKLVILMNEFGEVGMDGTLVDMEEINVLEISKGSIFCVCVKTDFIKGLLELASKIIPEVLLIESTGVANPTDLKKDLDLPIFKGIFTLKEQFCIVDASNFLNEFGVFASVENQIASSTRFIINKADLASSPSQINEIKGLIGNYHPDPVFYETVFADVDVAHLLLQEAQVRRAAEITEVSGEELDSYIEELLNDPGFSLMPPDILMSATFFWNEVNLPAIGELSAKLPGKVIRAKGFICSGARTLLYSFVMGKYDLEERNVRIKDIQENVLVFIFHPDALIGLEKVMKEYNFSKVGELMRERL